MIFYYYYFIFFTYRLALGIVAELLKGKSEWTSHSLISPLSNTNSVLKIRIILPDKLGLAVNLSGTP